MLVTTDPAHANGSWWSNVQLADTVNATKSAVGRAIDLLPDSEEPQTRTMRTGGRRVCFNVERDEGLGMCPSSRSRATRPCQSSSVS